MGRNEEIDELNEVSWLAFKWVAIGVGAVVIMGLIGAFWIRPAIMDAERRQNVKSSEYVEGKRTVLERDLTACATLEAGIADLEAANDPADTQRLAGKRAQLRALINEMRTDADEIPSDAVPPEVQRYLDNHQEGQTP